MKLQHLHLLHTLSIAMIAISVVLAIVHENWCISLCGLRCDAIVIPLGCPVVHRLAAAPQCHEAMIELIDRTAEYIDNLAIISEYGYSYVELIPYAAITQKLLEHQDDLQEAPIAFLIPASFEYITVQWGIWEAGGIAVPLSIHHPLPSLKYILEDTGAQILIVDKDYHDWIAPLAQELSINLMRVEELDLLTSKWKNLPRFSMDRRAMILYESGTTSQPRGVVSTHANIQSQIITLVDAWEWQEEDHILCILPLNHFYGIINVCSSALWSGACIEFLPKFDAKTACDLFLQGRINVFMAVPIIYVKLIAYWEGLPPDEQQALSDCWKSFRLMVSSSTALPASVLEKWCEISGHTLLECYGMTEIGMAVSNSYRGERRPGHIGLPLPRVELRLVDEHDNPVEAGTQGEIQVKGPSIFKEYWRKPEATAAAFTEDGWFRTGDIAVLNEGSYRMLGRNSVDIIMSGGYNISALEIEEVMRAYPGIKDCGVIGIPDEECGEIVVASLVLAKNEIDEVRLDTWLRTQLPAYKIPSRYIYQEDLARNALGKVPKHELKKCF